MDCSVMCRRYANGNELLVYASVALSSHDLREKTVDFSDMRESHMWYNINTDYLNISGNFVIDYLVDYYSALIRNISINGCLWK